MALVEGRMRSSARPAVGSVSGVAGEAVRLGLLAGTLEGLVAAK